MKQQTKMYVPVFMPNSPTLDTKPKSCFCRGLNTVKLETNLSFPYSNESASTSALGSIALCSAAGSVAVRILSYDNAEVKRVFSTTKRR